ncbi:MAG: DUF1003 domain-containing protein [Ferruginibacter sp.]
MNINTENFLKSGDKQLIKLESIVKQAIAEEKLITENLLHQPKEILSKGQSISDKVASFGGSWKFIIIFSIILICWILFNTLSPHNKEFDPYPFILMNLLLSAIAALQAPIIMMSQNRKEEKDRKRSENDYLINLKAELEVRSLHQKIDLLIEDQIKVLYNSQAKQLELLQKIEERLEKQGHQ